MGRLHGGLTWSVLHTGGVGARVGRVSAIHYAGSRSQLHVPTTFLALDIFVDILDVRNHLVLPRRELVASLPLLAICGGHLGDDWSLLHVGLGGVEQSLLDLVLALTFLGEPGCIGRLLSILCMWGQEMGSNVPIFDFDEGMGAAPSVTLRSGRGVSLLKYEFLALCLGHHDLLLGC